MEVRIKIRGAPRAEEAQRRHVTLRGVVPGGSGSGKAVGREHIRGEAVTKIEEGQELRRGQVASEIRGPPTSAPEPRVPP